MGTPRSYDVFLTFHHAGNEIDELVRAAAAMQVNRCTARLFGVDLYYRADTDVLLLGLRFDPHTATGALIERVRDDADRAGASVLELPRLADEDRRRFYDEYLPGYPMRLLNLPTPADAMSVLALDLGHEFAADTRPRFGRATPTRPPGPRLEVHYTRGDGWQLGRARNLTREGVYIVAGATPRRDDIVEVRLSAGQQRFHGRAQVVYVTDEDVASAMGAAGFGVRFLLGGGPEERQRLERIVASTLGDAPASVRAAPPRRDVRYPLRWPVSIDLGHATASLAALDVSARGMFVGCNAPHLPPTLDVRLPIDDQGGMLRASARVARAVPPQVAAERGTASGFGLEMIGFSLSDEARFRMFVSRVGRRSERNVLVAAPTDRVSLLAAELAAAGYVAASATDPEAVVARAALPRPPDLVVIDEAFEHTGARSVRAMRHALAKRDVQVCFFDGEQPAAIARALVDAALLA